MAEDPEKEIRSYLYSIILYKRKVPYGLLCFGKWRKSISLPAGVIGDSLDAFGAYFYLFKGCFMSSTNEPGDLYFSCLDIGHKNSRLSWSFALP